MLHGRMLRYLDEAARRGSIRKAAAHLNVASSAINRQILALERELGAPLFERMPRRLRLTAAGELVIAHVRNTLKGYDRLTAELSALKGIQRGRVSMATTFGLAMGPIRPAISDFLDQHRGVQVEVRALVADAIPNAVLSGEVDLGLSYNLAPDPNLRSQVSLPVPVVVVVPPGHPLAEHHTVRLADIVAYPMILPMLGMTIRDILNRAFTEQGISYRPEVETNSVEMIKLLVATPPRLTVLNPMDAIAEQQRGELVFLDLADRQIRPQSLQIITRQKGPTDFVANLFIEKLRISLTSQVDQLPTPKTSF
jgi:DNA-binding transcriptional LysR family regulator